MKEKVTPEKLMEQLVNINNQISGLQMLLEARKKMLAKYFEASGETSIQNDEATVYVRSNVKVDYDVYEIARKLDKKLSSKFIDITYEVTDWSGFTRVLKAHGVRPEQIRPFIRTSKNINQKSISTMYDRGEITLEDLKGCYTSTVNKSIVLKMKNVDRSMKVTTEEASNERKRK